MGIAMRRIGVFVLVTLSLILTCGLGWAKTPGIGIQLDFDKNVYTLGEPIGATIYVVNNLREDIRINGGFSQMDPFLHMRVIGPGGRLLIGKSFDPHDEFPDAAPLAYALYDKTPVPVVPCEVIKAGTKLRVRSEDMRGYYSLDRPGKFSAQVQFSAMTFKHTLCSVSNYEWLGMIESEPQSFFIEKPAESKKSAVENHFEPGESGKQPLVLAKTVTGEERAIKARKVGVHAPGNTRELRPVALAIKPPSGLLMAQSTKKNPKPRFQIPPRILSNRALRWTWQ